MKSNRGFTLVELLVYATIFTVTAGLLTAVLTNVTRVNNKQASGTEVAQQLNFVLSTVQNLVNDSSLIEAVYEGSDTGAACSQFCTLKLRMASSTLDVTYVSSDTLGVYLKQGDNATSTLTNDRIKVDKFNLTKFEFDGGHASVRLDMAFTYNADNPQLSITRSIQSAFGRANAAVFDDNLLPGTDNSYDVGQVSGSKRWRDAAFSNNITIEGSLAVGATSTNASALVDLTSTTLGFLPPRMTTVQRDAVSSPAAGLLVYNSTDNALNLYDGSAWGAVGTGQWTASSTDIYNANAGNVGIGTSTPAYKLDVSGVIRSTGDIYITKGSSPFFGTTDAQDLRLGTGLTERIRITSAGDLQYNGDLRPYRNSTAYTAYTYVPLTTALTSSSWNYTAKAQNITIDLQSVFGVPAGVKAVNVAVRFKDGTAGSFANLAPVNVGTDVGAVFQNAEVAGQWVGMDGVVPTNSNGDIVWSTNTGTMDSVRMVIWGYWI